LDYLLASSFARSVRSEQDEVKGAKTVPEYRKAEKTLVIRISNARLVEKFGSFTEYVNFATEFEEMIQRYERAAIYESLENR
jgi:hypothetical protein